MNRIPKRKYGLFPLSLHLRLTLLVTGLLVLLTGSVGILVSRSIRDILLQEIGKRALVLSQAVALDPVIRTGLASQNAEAVQLVAEQIRRTTGAEYVVVADREGIRYSHPYPDRLGRQFVGGDFHAAIERGESYVSQAVGTLGPAMRAFVPVRGGGGEVTGFVAAGYLKKEIDANVRSEQMHILVYIAGVLLLGVIGAMSIAGRFKSAIFGLEPHEIAALFEERNAIIAAIREGITAVDGTGRLTFVNEAALRYLGQSVKDEISGCRLTDICMCPEMDRALVAGERLLDHELTAWGRTMIVNVIPLKGASGAVASFRPKDELDRVVRELSHMQEYSELLRVQTHEYSNKLHTIAGLIQIGAHQEALELVMKETSGYQEIVKTLVRAVPDPIVAGIILGKFNRARELNVDFSLNPESSFSDLPRHIDRTHLITVIGNLLDNAFEAARESGKDSRVQLFLTDLGIDLIIEVEDSGRGVSQEIADDLFRKGVTTRRGPGRGIGLFLAHRAVKALGGDITFSTGALGGALFMVIIPKGNTPT